MFRNISLALIFLGTAILALPSIADAYCVGWDKELPGYDPHYYSVAHEFRRAKYVVVARAKREVWLGEDGKPKPLQPPFQFGSPRPWGFDPYSGVLYTVEIISALKGTPPDWLQVFSENSTGRFWLKVGQPYILFLSEQNFGNPAEGPPLGWHLYADNCGNSAWLSEAGKVARAAEALSLRSIGIRPKPHGQ